MPSPKCISTPAPRQPRYLQLADYCRATFDATGIMPSYRMIREALRIGDDGSVRRYVKQAEAEGLLWLGDYTGGRGNRQGQRIRFGTPVDDAKGRKTIRLGLPGEE